MNKFVQAVAAAITVSAVIPNAMAELETINKEEQEEWCALSVYKDGKLVEREISYISQENVVEVRATCTENGEPVKRTFVFRHAERGNIPLEAIVKLMLHHESNEGGVAVYVLPLRSVDSRPYDPVEEKEDVRSVMVSFPMTEVK